MKCGAPYRRLSNLRMARLLSCSGVAKHSDVEAIRRLDNLRYIFRGIGMKDTCAHPDQIQKVTPGASGCEDSMRGGGGWLHLRLCLTCGRVGCCDSSPNKHVTKHYHATKHPLIRSFEPGEEWVWRYADELFFESP
jgi:Zn-finger in ubiquitin-hydrolases and other protein